MGLSLGLELDRTAISFVQSMSFVAYHLIQGLESCEEKAEPYDEVRCTHVIPAAKPEMLRRTIRSPIANHHVDPQTQQIDSLPFLF